MNCLCNEIMTAQFGLREKTRQIVVHLTGCPEDAETKAYDALPWYKKYFAFNPHKIYRIHINQTIGRV